MRRTCRRTYSGSEEGVLLVTVRTMFLGSDLRYSSERGVGATG